eukprot:2490879-Pyramimonas_sp.AAC.1
MGRRSCKPPRGHETCEWCADTGAGPPHGPASGVAPRGAAGRVRVCRQERGAAVRTLPLRPS